MLKIRACFMSIRHKLTQGNPYKEDALGAIAGGLIALPFGGWRLCAATVAVSLIYRLWEGPSQKGWAHYAGKAFCCILAAQLILFAEERMMCLFPAVYWILFAVLTVGYVGWSRHFFLSAGMLFAIMLVALAGTEETGPVLGALMGAVCGFFPTQKRENAGKNIKFV